MGEESGSRLLANAAPEALLWNQLSACKQQPCIACKDSTTYSDALYVTLASIPGRTSHFT